jgi:DNA mismatch repair protein MutL
MSPRIEILPDHVANQIAAGEVVERPASVVKELVENALDAGAIRIEVSLRNGGKTEVRVSDDGYGMERADALLALDRHATSKIRSAEDLTSISSFGFRGEALPSIAAVSRFQLDTASEDGIGSRVKVTAGRVHGDEEIARQRGTMVTVRSLFHNVPARAKFLRSAAAETRAVSEAILLLALCNLAVAFRLESNDRELLNVPSARTLTERIAAIWGDERASELVDIVHEGEGLRVGGLVQRPDAARPRGGRRYLFVNGRPIRDPGLVRLVDEAYRTTVAPGLRPVFFVYLAMPPSGVDVNVHPAKAEVRFRDRAAVETAVREAVLRTLADLGSVPPLERFERTGARLAESTPGELDRLGIGPAESSRGKAPYSTDAAVPIPDVPQLTFFVPERADDRTSAPGAVLSEAPRLRRPELWQLLRRYILASTRDGLLIIDQHSAHERVLYEEIMGRFEGEGGESQRLLFPITLRLSPAEFSAIEELTGMLRRVGFEIEPFGERTVMVSASPHPHPYFDAERCLRDMIHELTEGSPLVDSARNQHERIAKSMACKGAIKAGQPLSEDEMAELIDRLFATPLPGHDVHGRPTIVRLTVDELDRRFGRT